MLCDLGVGKNERSHPHLCSAHIFPIFSRLRQLGLSGLSKKGKERKMGKDLSQQLSTSCSFLKNWGNIEEKEVSSKGCLAVSFLLPLEPWYNMDSRESGRRRRGIVMLFPSRNSISEATLTVNAIHSWLAGQSITVPNWSSKYQIIHYIFRFFKRQNI